MTENKAFIPLYLNNDVVNNLFSVVVQEFVEAKSTSVKDQTTISYRVPISEFSKEIFGKCIQGELNIQIVNEFSKQKSSVAISKDIEVFMELRRILFQNNLLRYVESNENVESIHENDFILVKCNLFQNPMVNYIENIINKVEILNVLGNIKAINGSRIEIMNNLKDYMDTFKNNNCIRYVTNEMCNPKSRFIIPMDFKYNMTKFDYTDNCKINIMGKVIGTIKDNNPMNLYGANLLNFIKDSNFSEFASNITNNDSIEKFCSRYEVKNGSLVNVLPIAIFL
ncbi:DUF6414 family protein [Clostridium akagii]|uniref:DUF6414 family protein n=1 Tax=Clostridium akagii TaxID=91623 RepID=UPI00047C0028|nr:hypothetical protein [Clostridium akagii]